MHAISLLCFRNWYYIRRGFERRRNAGVSPLSLDLSVIRGRINDSERVVDYLNTMICHGTMGARTYRTIVNALNSATGSNDDKLKLAIYAAVTSPEGAILR